VAQSNVAHFVADHRFHFVVGHHVHQPAIDADTAVRHREGVHVFRHVHLVVHRLAVDVVAQRGSNLIQTLRVGTVSRRKRGFSVHIFTGLVAQRFHLRIAQGIGLKGLCA
jgi:hypothetical protein